MGLITNIRTGLKLKNSYLVFEVIKKISNWPIYFLDFFSLIWGKYIVYNMRNGLKFLVRAKTCDRGVVTAVCIADEYRINDLSLPKNSIVIDIGANIGTFSVCIAKMAGKVFSYEPVTENYQMLLKNIELNMFNDVTNAFNLAVSGKNGKLKIYLSEINPGQHSICNVGNKYEEVESIALKDVFDSNNIKQCDLLKIDTEGSEYDILYNLPDEYYKKIKRIYLEHHNVNIFLPKNIHNNHNHNYLKIFLEKRGFNVFMQDNYIFANNNIAYEIQ